MERYRKISVAVVCNILGHGNTYNEWSTSFIIAMSKIDDISMIHLIVPPGYWPYPLKLPDNCSIHQLLDYDHPISMLRVLGLVNKLQCDDVVFISGPTAFGKGNISNFIGMVLPYIIKVLYNKKVAIINQGSSYTHDVSSLGYQGLRNFLKLRFIMLLERFIFGRVKTYFQLRFYADIIEKRLGRRYVAGILPSDFIDPLAALYINDLLEKEHVRRNINGENIRILLHGFWGPQKSPDVALKAVKNTKAKHNSISLTVSGGINNHFPHYKEYFERLIHQYGDVIDQYLGYVDEMKLPELFLTHQIVLMPYRSSGGQSGVLETASFFENIVVCTDFPEFQEERKSDLVILTNLEDFEQSLSKAIGIVKEIPNIINVQSKVQTVINNIRDFLAD